MSERQNTTSTEEMRRSPDQREGRVETRLAEHIGAVAGATTIQSTAESAAKTRIAIIMANLDQMDFVTN